MKKLVTTLLFLSCCLQSYSQITWSTPVTVYSGSGSNLHPRIALNRAGNPMILWGKTNTRAYFSRWTGTTFTGPTTISGSLTVFSQYWAGPDLASFGDTVYATMKVTPENVPSAYDYLVHSYDGGMTFSAPVRIDNIDTNTSRFPIVTTTSNGNPLVAFMKFNSSSLNTWAHYVVARSADYGLTFSSEVQASGSTGVVCDCCPATIISAGTKAIMLFRNNLSNIRDIWAGISPDGGITFPGAGLMQVDNTNWNISSCPASGPDGYVSGDSIYTVFMSSASGTAMVYLSKSSISGMSSSTSAITGSFAGLNSQNYPRIANSGNASAVVWLQKTTAGDSIEYSFTNNIASGFPGRKAVPGAYGTGVMNADIAMAPGVVHIVWEDDNTGNVMYVKGTYLVTTSVAPVAVKQLIDIYPNPAKDAFSVSLKNIGNIIDCHLTEITGRNIELKPSVNNDRADFSLKNVAKGGYYFVMTDEAGKTYYSKLIVQ